MGLIQFMERVIGTTFTKRPVSQRLGVVSFGFASEKRYDRKPHELMLDALNAYEARPFVHSGINQLSLLITGGHLTCKGSEEGDVEKIQKWIDYRSHLHGEVELLVKLFLITGNVPLEKAFILKNDRMYIDDFFVFPRPDRFYRSLYVYDEDGNYVDDDERYWLVEVDRASRGLLVDGKSMNPQMFRITYSPYAIAPVNMIYAIPFHKKKFCYLRSSYKKWFFYSYSFVMSSLDDIDAMYNIIQNIIGISKYKAIGKSVFNIGDEKNPASPEDIENLKADLQSGTFTNLVINKKVQKTSLSYEGDYNTMINELDFLRKEIGSGLTPNYLTPWNSEVNRACLKLGETFVLTETRGWVLQEDVLEGEKIALYDRDFNRMIFKEPVTLHKYDVIDEDMYSCDSRVAKFSVTGEHKILYKTDSRLKNFSISKCKDIFHYKKIIHKTASEYKNGKDYSMIELPSVRILGYKTAPLMVDADWLFKFTGIFLAEGCHLNIKTSHASCIGISQSMKVNPEKVAVIDELMKKSPFKYSRTIDKTGIVRWHMSHKQLQKWLYDNCGHKSYEKRIPREFLNACPKQLKLLFDFMVLGDGSVHEANHKKNCERKGIEYYKKYKHSICTYATTSKKLADDFQELGIKLGYSCNVDLAYKANGNRRNYWRVSVNGLQERSVNESERFIEKYTGKVGCFETDTGYYFVKVKDTVHVTGNSSNETKIVLDKQLQIWRRTILDFLNENILKSVKEMLNITSDVEFDFADVDLYTPEDKQQYLSALYNDNMLTVNEYRLKMGLDTIEGGDVFKTEYENAMLGQGQEAEPIYSEEGRRLKEELKTQREVAGHVISLHNIDANTWQVWDGSEVKLSIDDEQTARTFYDRLIKKIKDGDLPLVETDYKEEEEKVTKELDNTVKSLKKDVDDLLSTHTEAVKTINTDVVPKIDNLFKKAFSNLQSKFRKTIGDVFNSSKTSVMTAIASAALGKGKEMPDTSKIKDVNMADLKLDAVEKTYQQDLKNLKNQKVADLSRMVADATATGVPSSKIKAQVLKSVGDIHHEAERILRTNVNRTSTMSKLLMYQKMDIKKFQWLAHIDERTREAHRKRHLRVFNVNRALQGLDPAPTMVRDKSGKWIPSENINCRCTVRPYFD